MKTKNGKEHGTKWEIEWNGRKIKISVSKEDDSETETREYECQYPILFGYDVYDCEQVERILDEMIVKHANDGYSGIEEQ